MSVGGAILLLLLINWRRRIVLIYFGDLEMIFNIKGHEVKTGEVESGKIGQTKYAFYPRSLLSSCEGFANVSAWSFPQSLNKNGAMKTYYYVKLTACARTRFS